MEEKSSKKTESDILYKEYEIPEDIQSYFPEGIGFVISTDEKKVENYFNRIRELLKRDPNASGAC